jgi:magnesium-transporting ATPase (P-type)
VVVTIGYVGLGAAALTFIAMGLRLIFEIFYYKHRLITDKENIADILDAFIVAVTVVVMAIPEGLPLAVAICLAFSVGKLQDKH